MKLRDAGKARTETLAEDLHSAAIHLLRRVRKQDVRTGEGPARLSALSVLVFGGPLTLGQLAAAEQVKPPTMTRIVNGLEDSQLAERVPDSQDARRVRICATAKGKALLLRGRRLRVQYLERQLGGLRGDQLRRLEEGLEILQEVLKNWEKD